MLGRPLSALYGQEVPGRSACHTRPVGEPEHEALRETMLEQEWLYEGRIISLRRDVVADADGERRQREVVVHPGAVAVVPLLDDGRLLLVRQYRHAAGIVCLEIPAGTLDRLADGSLEPPDDCARRELAEETGHSAASWLTLGSFYTAPGFATEQMHLYLATDLSPIDGYSGPAADERLQLERVDWPSALEMALAGEIQDAKTLVGVFWLARLIDDGQLSRFSALR
jgi:ADP-ribose pyrophosphatase